jgi:hypothetical protein
LIDKAANDDMLATAALIAGDWFAAAAVAGVILMMPP